jgi:hypothetical protein
MPRLAIDIDVDDAAVTGGRAAGVDGVATDGPHIRGTLFGPDGSVSAFVGWVGLLALLQRAIAEPAPGPSPGPETS